MSESSDRYFAVLDDLAGGGGRRYHISPPNDPTPVWVAAYDAVPEEGHVTGFSFGLSSATHPEWTRGRPELMISVRSTDHAWALCMGEIVRHHRDETLFSYGTILHFRQRVVEDCPMTSFLVFASSLLDGSQQRVVLPDRTIHIAQLYPIYEEEAALVREVGVESFFWEMGIDFADTRRPAVTRV